VTAVAPDTQTVTINDRGGSRDLHGTSVTITVPDAAQVEREDATATPGPARGGDHLAANGSRSDGPTFTAKHVSAEAPGDDSGDNDTSGD
jgi:hypothetical protein